MKISQAEKDWIDETFKNVPFTSELDLKGHAKAVKEMDDEQGKILSLIDKVSHTSERFWNGTIYTFADARFPEYDGRQILVERKHQKTIAKWI